MWAQFGGDLPSVACAFWFPAVVLPCDNSSSTSQLSDIVSTTTLIPFNVAYFLGIVEKDRRVWLWRMRLWRRISREALLLRQGKTWDQILCKNRGCSTGSLDSHFFFVCCILVSLFFCLWLFILRSYWQFPSAYK